jgi:hypothetical protein
MDAGSKVERIGCIQSDEMLHFDEPYHDNYATLCFRTDGSAIFSIEDGQILSGDDHGARIRLGNAAPRSFGLDQPSDYSSTSVFIAPASPLFAAAKAGKSGV